MARRAGPVLPPNAVADRHLQAQSYEYTITHKSGSVRDVIFARSSAFRDDNDQVGGIIGVFFDITDRKEQEARIAASEAKYRAVFDNASIDWRGRCLPAFLEVNETYCAIIGYSRDAGVGPDFSFKRITDPDDLDNSEALVRRAVGLRRQRRERYLRKDGKQWVVPPSTAPNGTLPASPSISSPPRRTSPSASGWRPNSSTGSGSRNWSGNEPMNSGSRRRNW